MSELRGRKKPYSRVGIRRVPCVRCGGVSIHQWRVCADGFYRPVCAACDADLNRMIMDFLGLDRGREKLTAYKEMAR